MSEIWAHHGEPPASFGNWSDVPGLPPGMLAQARRAEALERHREQREAAERQARAEDRFELWAVRRMSEMSAAGQPFDPGDWRTLVEDPAVLAERVFAAQDAESRRLERRALLEAGVLHLLDLRADEVAPAAGPPTEPTPPATRAERETGYVRLRLARFRRHLADASTRTGKERT